MKRIVKVEGREMKEGVGKKAADDRIYELEEALDNLSGALEEVIEVADRAKDIADDIGGEVSRVVGGQLDLYLMGNVESFINNRNQPGSVASLHHFLEKFIKEELQKGSEED
jgi:hypothetical protein